MANDLGRRLILSFQDRLATTCSTVDTLIGPTSHRNMLNKGESTSHLDFSGSKNLNFASDSVFDNLIEEGRELHVSNFEHFISAVYTAENKHQ